MRKVIVFNSVSLDGYFVDVNGDISWAHRNGNDPEWNSFIESNAKGEGILLFGRKTYDLMVSYWPTPTAKQNDPVVAERMNNYSKIVFSKTMEKAEWNNTKLFKSDPVKEVTKLKNEPGPDIVIFGSGIIIAQLASQELIDEYRLVIIPVVLGSGRTMFEGIKDKLELKMTKSRTFSNGNAYLCYEPVR